MESQPVVKSHAQQVIELKTGEAIDVTLRRLYVMRRMTQAQIASALGVSRQTVNGWMQDFGIEARRPDPEPDVEAIA